MRTTVLLVCLAVVCCVVGCKAPPKAAQPKADAKVALPPPPPPKDRVALHDGSVLIGKVKSIQGGKLTLITRFADTLTVDLAKVKGVGSTGEGSQTVQGRLELRCCNVADISPSAADADAQIVATLKEMFRLIGGPAALAAAGRA